MTAYELRISDWSSDVCSSDLIEDNQYGISVPVTYQTPGGNIAKNLESFTNLHVLSGDGTEPAEAARLLKMASDHVRGGKGPALLRLTVPRLRGHSYQDTQTYKSEEFVESECARDPLPKLKSYLVGSLLDESEWDEVEAEAEAAVEKAREIAEARGVADPETVLSNVFYEGEMQRSEEHTSELQSLMRISYAVFCLKK